jgi:hypothetical protein
MAGKITVKNDNNSVIFSIVVPNMEAIAWKFYC